jgi:microcin C transport system permease protein
MTFPRKLGLLLILVAGLASIGYRYGLELPSLRWFFSFRAEPGTFDPQSWLAHKEATIGYSVCGLAAFIGLLCVLLGGKFQWNPLTVKKFKRFRTLDRGWRSFLLLVLLLVLALLDQTLVGRRALVVKYQGQWHFPAYERKFYSEAFFGGSSGQEVDYRKLKLGFEKEAKGDLVVLPPIPWDPTFDSDDVIHMPLVNKSGEVFLPDGKEPYNGQGSQFLEGNESVKVREARFRKGKLDGNATLYDENGEFLGRETWKAGELLTTSLAEGQELPKSGPWMKLVYPPMPPNITAGHFHLLGTDSKGWDIAAQLYGGLQVLFKAACLYVLLTYGVGITLGSMMGYFGGMFDLMVQRLIEVLSNVPFLLVIMIIASRIGREKMDLVTILLLMGAFSWITVSIYLRTSTYKEKARDYVAAARVQGAGTARIIFRHILPNAMSTVVTLLPFSISGLATSITALDFLGFGLPDRYPSWGRVMEDGTSNLGSPWIVASVFSIMVILLLLITFIGEAIREAFDPKKFTTYQ